MNKTLNHSTRSFGQNLKNNLTENDVEAQLALKPRPKKRLEINNPQSTSSSLRPEI